MLTFKKAEAYAPFDLKVNKEAEMLFENVPELEEFKNTSQQSNIFSKAGKMTKTLPSNEVYKSKNGRTYGLF